MKNKVTFFMKSGNKFSLKFKSFEISKLSGSKGNREMSHDGDRLAFTIDVDEIEAITIKKVLF